MNKLNRFYFIVYPLNLAQYFLCFHTDVMLSDGIVGGIFTILTICTTMTCVIFVLVAFFHSIRVLENNIKNYKNILYWIVVVPWLITTFFIYKEILLAAGIGKI